MKLLILLSIFTLALALPQDYSRLRRSGGGWDAGYGDNYGGYDGVYDVGFGSNTGYGPIVEDNYRIGNYQTGYHGGYDTGYDSYNGYQY